MGWRKQRLRRSSRRRHSQIGYRSCFVLYSENFQHNDLTFFSSLSRSVISSSPSCSSSSGPSNILRHLANRSKRLESTRNSIVAPFHCPSGISLAHPPIRSSERIISKISRRTSTISCLEYSIFSFILLTYNAWHSGWEIWRFLCASTKSDRFGSPLLALVMLRQNDTAKITKI